MADLEHPRKGFLSSLDKCNEETKILLFLVTTIQSLILAISICNILPDTKEEPQSLMQSLQHELRVSGDKEYCKQVIQQLMELQLRENQNQQTIVVNVPASIANVSSSGK